MISRDRRTFLRQAATLAGAFSANSLFDQAHAADFHSAAAPIAGLNALEAAQDEDYWAVIQRGYSVNPNLINLNNGGVSPSPIVVQQAVERYNQLSNEGPSYFMWRILDQGREPLREKLAALAGARPGEIAINRNSTEALNTIIYGIDLKPGDEVIGTKQDYPHMIEAYRQRAMREGIVYKQLSFDFPIEDDAVIVKAYEDAITPRTKLIHVTHMINWVGQTHAGAQDRRHGARARHRSAVRRRALLRPDRLQNPRPRLRLLRHQPAQISLRAHRHGHAVDPVRQD